MNSSLARLSALSATKRELKRGLMQQLLTARVRFPQFRSAPVWGQVRLGEVAASVTRRNAESSVQRVLTCSGEHGLIDQQDFFSKIVASELREDYFLLERGEFAYNRSAMAGYPYGATKRLDRYEMGALSTLNICFALANERLVADYAVHVFESGLLNDQLRRITRVGSRAHGLLNVTKADFFELRLPLPSLEEQRRIADMLNALDREILVLEELYDAYYQQKRVLVKQLLFGEIEISGELTDGGCKDA
ncbi:MAG: hypothetical protein GEU90_20015 [Gemmatimonas sp.]|nr:hypothetical protein [Gemmatimonas sp.]